ncbi:LytTR family DNA-binding domain-containing protein [Lentibacillus saliphilus]|uniref:LytTR family DNA-binding domain-containing protein n=1 Tax=Lentibacillus saliphilus TaxID=2737028 RepID=UPI001C2F158F|nr:LytTR family DNA-binding domain-containing protein [Lentibacillus saliphilus]
MKVNIDINETYSNTTITIQAPAWNEELQNIVDIMNNKMPKRLFATRDDETILLKAEAIDFVFAEQRKVFAVTSDGHYEIKMKLFEVEQILLNYHFSRFSKSVIGNLNRITRFELSFNGNLCVYFISGMKTYISRKYVKDIKNKLALGGDDL